MASSSAPSSAPSSRSFIEDLVAGFLIVSVTLPLCLAAAMASGFPPVAGLITAIVGVAITVIGGARLAGKGPAIGMIVIVFGAVTQLGHGDPMAGYRQVLAIGVVAAALQIVLALLRAASSLAKVPRAVGAGLLAALGVILVAEQAHGSFGVTPESRRPLALLFEIPSTVVHADPKLALLGLASLGVLFGMPLLTRRMPRLGKIPPPLLMLVIAVALGFGLGLGRLPGAAIDMLALPDFSRITSPVSLGYIVVFASIGSLESTLGVLADPARRGSNLDRDLLVVGLGNLVCAAIGGLPMVSQPVRGG
ncbi:MAG TPA: SulP family inorganic anion transporter, partial [Enhygromyxa sp.]|nr:SulP family inorganic anion transporter [Enhygromyxa sp.]